MHLSFNQPTNAFEMSFTDPYFGVSTFLIFHTLKLQTQDENKIDEDQYSKKQTAPTRKEFAATEFNKSLLEVNKS